MPDGEYITVRETAQLLGISEKKVMDLIEGEKLTGYRIANQFLRLKKTEVLKLRNSGHVEVEITQIPYSRMERIKDFLYFNDFYLISGGLILILLYVIITAT